MSLAEQLYKRSRSIVRARLCRIGEAHVCSTDFCAQRRTRLGDAAAREQSSAARSAPMHAPVEGCAVVQVHLCSLRVCWARRVRVRQQALRSVTTCQRRGKRRCNARDVSTGGTCHRCSSADTRAWMLVSSVDTLWIGLHWSWMMSMHSVPSEYTARPRRRGSQVSRCTGA